MAFVNTRDTIGDQATVDGLVEDSLTELKEDGIRKLPAYSLYNKKNISSINFPNIIELDEHAINNCGKLEELIIGHDNNNSNIVFKNEACKSCGSLSHLVLNSSTVATFGSKCLKYAQLERHTGAIYVPENLIEAYKNDNNWKYFSESFHAIDEYPIQNLDSISDSWDEIFSNQAYNSKYSIADTKSLTLLDGTTIMLDLIGLDIDEKSDNSGTAKMTWLCHDIYFRHAVNDIKTKSGGWANSDLREWLETDILPLIPTEIKQHIAPVKKYYKSSSSGSIDISNDTLWCPSIYELDNGSIGASERNGVQYTEYYSKRDMNGYSDLYLVKPCVDINSAAYVWALRSVGTNGNYYYIAANGSPSAYPANSKYGVVFGFCTD